MPTDDRPEENTYIIDAGDAAEMARLLDQDRIFTESMGGALPEELDLANIHDVLDIACGPGGWVRDLARANPGMQLTGVDVSKLMIDFARAEARVQWLNNAHFRVMDVLKPLDFPDGSFDVVNARAIIGFMPTTAWSRLMRECARITRPGGILRLTEFDTYGTTNSFALEKLNTIGFRAFRLKGQSFSQDDRSLGITPMLGRFLLDAGCINVKMKAYVIDFSAGTEAHESMYQNTQFAIKLSQPFLIKMKVATQEELDGLYEQALMEMMREDFRGLWYYLSAWGEKVG
ncbi:MAG TPA: class I SAM-dependent methyltransferase [Ktedonobacteraceae bacterium]|nr:class I SAM-dependent methyltransferase [Ktedonobacteraceae bacterium]